MRKIFLVLSLFVLPINALELERVILASNNDPKYIQFWSIVAPLWERMGLRPTLALIGDTEYPVDTSIGDVIRFDPLPGVPESLQAQVIRLFLPILFPEEGCIISDIDMIPISTSYFKDGAAPCPDDAFLVYRNRAYGGQQKYPMCYLAGKGTVFRSIFGISRYEDIPELIRYFAEAGHGWNTDEIMLYAYAKAWEKKGGRIFCLHHGVERRLDRGHWNVDFSKLDISRYIDCHCPRPYSAYKESIDQVVHAILTEKQ